jgi:large subunit ribosomal protein L7Ae
MGVAKKPAPAKKAPAKKVANPLFPARPKSFRIGGAIQPTRDLSRFVRWPRYIRIQRQRKILMQRLKVPPSINQFAKALDKNGATELFKLLVAYQPETRQAKVQRLKAAAAAKEAGEETKTPKPIELKYGLKHVTTLVETKKAQLVCIASDVVPLELVVWLPALCRKMGVPYCIVKNKARLGTLVHKKNAACVALTAVRKEDAAKLDTLKNNYKAAFNQGFQRKWGGGIMGLKTQKKLEKRAKAIAAEDAKKAQF